MSMKNCNDAFGNRTRDLPACSVVPQPTASPGAPQNKETQIIILITCEQVFGNRQYIKMGRHSSVDIATRYGPDGRGIESRWGGEIFRTRPDRHLSAEKRN